MSMTIGVDLAGFDALLNQLDQDLQDAARPAAYAAGKVLYDAATTNVNGIGRVTGNLASALYIAYSKDNSGPGRATYHVSWNAKKAPHGHLVEWGHIQRYATYIDTRGQWKTAVRPEARAAKKKKPRRGASQAEKDAYYVTLPSPKHVAARPFIRPAASQFPQADQAAQGALLAYLRRTWLI